jgi:arylsulfatase A-like enzyme
MSEEKKITRRTAIKSITATALSSPGFSNLGTGVAGLMAAACQPSTSPDFRNIVMISIDDLNDYVGYLGGYGGDAHTPNLDALAASGRSYTNAHACVPVCMPSRAAVMFGRQPNTTGIYGHSGAFQPNPPTSTDFGRYRALLEDPTVLSLPQLVKLYANPNYVTMSMGKMFHSARPEQWDVQAPFTELSEIYSAYPSDSGDLFSYGPLAPGEIHQDQLTADWASSIMSKNASQPIFMAVGFYQPHLPWRLPQWAFDLHPIDSVVVPEYRPDDLDDVPPLGQSMAQQPWSAQFGSNFDLVLAKGTQTNIVQAYLAAMSHTDRMVGQVIDAIERGPNADNTDIILWSDHGYHLGEKLHVRKATLWEKSTRVPLIIRSPETSPGEVISNAVSLIDIAPTVIQMAGGRPGAAGSLDGVSLFSVGSSKVTSHWEGATSLRTDRWRYTRYPDDTEELYDHDVDPNEYDNLAGDESFGDIISGLRSNIV